MENERQKREGARVLKCKRTWTIVSKGVVAVLLNSEPFLTFH